MSRLIFLFFDAIKVYAVSKAASLPDGSFPWIPYPKLIITGKFSLIFFMEPGIVDFKCSVFISSKFFKFSSDEILKRVSVLPSYDLPYIIKSALSETADKYLKYAKIKSCLVC